MDNNTKNLSQYYPSVSEHAQTNKLVFINAETARQECIALFAINSFSMYKKTMRSIKSCNKLAYSTFLPFNVAFKSLDA